MITHARIGCDHIFSTTIGRASQDPKDYYHARLGLTRIKSGACFTRWAEPRFLLKPCSKCARTRLKTAPHVTQRPCITNPFVNDGPIFVKAFKFPKWPSTTPVPCRRKKKGLPSGIKNQMIDEQPAASQHLQKLNEAILAWSCIKPVEPFFVKLGIRKWRLKQLRPFSLSS